MKKRNRARERESISEREKAREKKRERKSEREKAREKKREREGERGREREREQKCMYCIHARTHIYTRTHFNGAYLEEDYQVLIYILNL